jgi:hypothetical protein
MSELSTGGFPPAGKLLTGNIGSLYEQQPLKALRAPGGLIPQYKILYCIINYLLQSPAWFEGNLNHLGAGAFEITSSNVPI